jgi:hypothetical protein
MKIDAMGYWGGAMEAAARRVPRVDDGGAYNSRWPEQAGALFVKIDPLSFLDFQLLASLEPSTHLLQASGCDRTIGED